MSLDDSPHTCIIQYYLVRDCQDVVSNDYSQGEEDEHHGNILLALIQ